jgi:hypothetical protein
MKTNMYVLYPCENHGKDSGMNFGVLILQIVKTGSEVHPNSYPMGTEGSFPGGKATGA